jgi:uncharacterized protein (TIGR03435 family)
MVFAGVGTDLSGHRVSLQRTPLASIVAAAYRVRAADVSCPSWMSSERFDIEAIIPKEANPNFASEMMQTLLAERFALKVHWEKKPLVAYGLFVGKQGPKLQPYEPAPTPAAVAAGSAAPAVPKPPDFTIPRSPAENVPWVRLNGGTMADLARTLTRLVGERVVDMTKLEGRYAIRIAGARPKLEEDTSGAPSIFDAVKDLGLQLERRKVEVDVLVVDSASKTPTAN